MEPYVAFPATPWIDSKNAQKVVSRGLTARASGVFAFADRAGHLGAPGLVSFRDSIGKSALASKYNKVLYGRYNSLGGIQSFPEETRMPEYTEEHAKAGIEAKLPKLETWPNQ